MNVDLARLPARLHRLGLVRGPLLARIAHIEENGTPWPELIGEEAKPLGGGRYAVGPMIVEFQPFRRASKYPLDPGEYWPENWQPLLPVLRTTHDPQKKGTNAP